MSKSRSGERSAEPDFLYLLGLSGPERRMRDVELVLRFAAFYHASYLNYKPSIRSFLNSDAKRFRQISGADAQALRKAFKKSCLLTRSLLDRNAFRRFYPGDETDPNGHWEQRRFNASLYDILMYGFTLYEAPQIYPYLDSLREGYISLMTDDPDFIGAIQISTSSTPRVLTRFDKWRLTMRAVIGSPRIEPRCFSLALKRELFESDPTCAICAQRISSIDDSAVDHVKQYWTGGKTIPENARLAHRFCNWSRPRTDVAD
ncbi:MAG: HNH endonuclease [Gemmatimonadota bacterium]|nr:HNH endonuclease [Gemmatimonadota bacterium]